MSKDDLVEPPESHPDFSDVLRVLRAAPDSPAPNLAPRVMARIRARRRVPLALAAGLLALLAACLLFPGHRPTNEPTLGSASDSFSAALSVTSIEVALALDPPVEPPESQLRKARGWLMRHQDANGGWAMGRSGAAANYVVGTSALAVLALLTDPSESSNAIRHGLEFLARQQDAHGLFGPSISGSLYNHALTCLAMIRAHKQVDASPSVERALRAGLALIVLNQRPEGGWTYLRSRGAPNSSLTVWAVQVLMEATECGIGDYTVELERGLAWLEHTLDAEGRVGYRRSGDHPHGSETLTAAAALCFIDRGAVADPRIARMIENVRRDIGNTASALDLYRAFFQAAALSAEPEPDAELPSLNARILAAQDMEGEDAGSWPPLDRWSAAGGRVYSTALAVLTLGGERAL